MTKKDHPAMNVHVPRKGTRIGSIIGTFILRIMGWKITGQFPHEKKIIIIGAPHTSNWDFIIAMSAVMSLRLKFKFMMKKQAFFWPFSSFWKYLGGVPIDRSKKNDITIQMSEWFNSQDNAYLGLTPEGHSFESPRV
jgi:1-acyl-sn-glycerol-3-phosphate acyltransferase